MLNRVGTLPSSVEVAAEIDPRNGEVWIRSADVDWANRPVKAAEDFLGLSRETLRRDQYAEFKALDRVERGH